MICGIGVDLVSVSRIDQAMNRFGDRFLDRIYTPEERRISNGQARFYAGRFGIKEALLKALGTGLSEGMRWQEIQTLCLSSGAPDVRCTGQVHALLGDRGVQRIWASLSHEKDQVVAMVLLEGFLP